MYKKVSTDMNFVGREKEVEAFWKEHDIFQKSMEEKEGCPEYTFYDGPPTANGKPHIGRFSTSSSTGRPWVSHPALRGTLYPFIVRYLGIISLITRVRT